MRHFQLEHSGKTYCGAEMEAGDLLSDEACPICVEGEWEALERKTRMIQHFNANREVMVATRPSREDHYERMKLDVVERWQRIREFA